MSSTCTVAALVALGVSAAAHAQGGFGLDLTDGADELRPNLAIIGSGIPQIDAAVVTAATRSDLFSSVLKPPDVSKKLGANAEEAMKCGEDACLAEIAEGLDVERTLSVQVSREGAATLVQLLAFHRGTLAIKSASVDTSGPLKPEFMKKLTGALQPLLQSVSAKLARLKVTPSVPKAQVTLGSREFPAGPVDVRVSAGSFKLTVSANGFKTVQQQVKLDEGGKADLPIRLVAGASRPTAIEEPVQLAQRPPERAPPTPVVAPPPPREEPERRASAPSTPPFAFMNNPMSLVTHPGTYVAVAGAVALGIGGGLGNYAKGVQLQAVDADANGILDINRGTAMAANTAGVVGTVMMIAGAAALAGGGAWVFVAPSTAGGMGVAAGGKF